MNVDFKRVEDLFMKILSEEQLSTTQIRTIEGNLSDAFCEISNSNTQAGIEEFRKFIEKIEQSNMEKVSISKFIYLKTLFNQYKEDFFDRFSLLNFCQNDSSIINSAKDENVSHQKEELDEENEDVMNLHELHDENTLSCLRQTLIKLEFVKIQKDHKIKEVLFKWRLLGYKNSIKRSKNVWKMVDCFGKIYKNKFKAFISIKIKSNMFKNTADGSEIQGFQNQIEQRREINDRLKRELDQLEEENRRISLFGANFRENNEKTINNLVEIANKNELCSPNIKSNETIEKNTNLLKNNNLLHSNLSKNEVQRHKSVTFADELEDKLTSTFRKPKKVESDIPFETRLTQIFPITDSDQKKVDENDISLMENIELYQQNLKGRSSNVLIPKRNSSDNDNSFIVNDLIPISKDLVSKNLQKNTQSSKKSRENEKKDDGVNELECQSVNSIDFYEKEYKNKNYLSKGAKPLSILRRVRILKIILESIKRKKVSLVFANFLKIVQKSKAAIKNVSDRMMAKLLVSTRQSICGFDIKKSFFHWYVHTNPDFAKRCVLKLLTRVPIRYHSAVFRLKLLILKPKNRMSKIEKIVTANTGLNTLEKLIGQKMRSISKSFFNNLTTEKFDRIKIRKFLEKIDKKFLLKIFKILKHFQKEKQVLLELLKTKSERKLKYAIGCLKTNEVALKSASLTKNITKLVDIEKKLKAKKLKSGFFMMKNHWIVFNKHRKDQKKSLFKLEKSLNEKNRFVFKGFRQFSAKRKKSEMSIFGKKVNFVDDFFEKSVSKLKQRYFEKLVRMNTQFNHELILKKSLYKKNYDTALFLMVKKIKEKQRLSIDLLNNWSKVIQKREFMVKEIGIKTLKRAISASEKKKLIIISYLRNNNKIKERKAQIMTYGLNKCASVMKHYKIINWLILKKRLNYLHRKQVIRQMQAQMNLKRIGFSIIMKLKDTISKFLQSLKNKSQKKEAALKFIVFLMKDSRWKILQNKFLKMRSQNKKKNMKIKALGIKLGLKSETKKRNCFQKLIETNNSFNNSVKKCRILGKTLNEAFFKNEMKNKFTFYANFLQFSVFEKFKETKYETQILDFFKTFKNKIQTKKGNVLQILLKNLIHKNLTIKNEHLIERHKKMQILRKKKGFMLVFTASQFHKLKTAFISFVNASRKLSQDLIKQSNQRNHLVSKLINSSLVKKREIFFKAVNFLRQKKKNEENEKTKKNNLHGKVLGSLNPIDFSNIDHRIFDKFVNNFQQNCDKLPSKTDKNKMESNLQKMIQNETNSLDLNQKKEINEFFDSLKDFCLNNPDDSLSKKIKKGEINSMQHLFEIISSEIKPKYLTLKENMSNLLNCVSNSKLKPKNEKKSYFLKKIHFKMQLFLSKLREFAKKTKKTNNKKISNQKKAIKNIFLFSALKLKFCLEKLKKTTNEKNSFEKNKKQQLFGHLLKSTMTKLRISFTKILSSRVCRKLYLNLFLKKISTICFKKSIENGQLFFIGAKTKILSKIKKIEKSEEIMKKLLQTRLIKSMHNIHNFSQSRHLNRVYSQLILLFQGIRKNHRSITRKYFDIFTRKKAKMQLMNFISKIDNLFRRRKMNALSNVTYIYFKGKYHDKIQAINMLMNLANFHQQTNVTIAMEIFVKKFKVNNPWFEKAINKMVKVQSFTDQNSFWKIKILRSHRESSLKPSDSLKLKRFLQIFDRGVFKNKSYGFFKVYDRMMVFLRKSGKFEIKFT